MNQTSVEAPHQAPVHHAPAQSVNHVNPVNNNEPVNIVDPAQAMVTFPDGLPGFESARQFLLITSPQMAPFTLVQGLGADAPSFLAIDPHQIDPAYRTAIVAADLARLGADDRSPLLWLVIVTARREGGATINLRAPLVINPASMRGIQMIAGDSIYPFDFPLPAA